MVITIKQDLDSNEYAVLIQERENDIPEAIEYVYKIEDAISKAKAILEAEICVKEIRKKAKGN